MQFSQFRRGDQKIKNITKTEIEQRRDFVYILDFSFFFYGVSHAKTDLHSKYMI